jgi:dCTP deaminase
MSDIRSPDNLFPTQDDASQNSAPENPGVIAWQGLRDMVRRGEIVSSVPIASEQFQPASLDLRLGRRAWRVRASFLPGPGSTVMERVRQLHEEADVPDIDLAQGAVFEKGIVYVVELLEHVKLANGLVGIANPKSSTGRVDVLVRLITDRATAFDRIERKYEGPLYLEVAPQAFSIVVRQGVRLNQLRFHRGMAGLPTTVPGGLQELYSRGQLVKPDGPFLPLRGNLVPLTVDLGGGDGGVVGYKAKKTTNTINLEKIRHYDPREFWEKISGNDRRLYLDKGDFYILATREEVGVPPHLAAEMVPYDSASGEFRVHYAGFFDPGFGWNECAGGSRAVLEVRSYGVSFMLEHGQTVGWLSYSRLAGGASDRVYGKDIASNYQGQSIALAKYFRPWPEG